MEGTDCRPTEEGYNYLRLLNLLNSIALPALRKLFCDSWRTKYQYDWENCEENGSRLFSDFGSNILKTNQAIQKKLLKSGNIEKWDLPLVINTLKAFPKKCTATVNMKQLEALKNIRNQLSHQGGIEVDKDSYEKMWQQSSNALTSLGISPQEIEKAKNMFYTENQPSLSAQKAIQLKEEGNLLFKNQDFTPAVAKYSEAILQPGISSMDLAVLYSNRSAAYLKLDNYYSAKEDGKAATLLQPTWWKGFTRLAQAYRTAEKFEQALENFEKALILDPSNKAVKAERDYCRLIVDKLKREDHLDPVSLPETFSERIQKMKESKEFSPMQAETLAKLAELPSFKNSPRGMCMEGQRYLHGDGVPQNYEMAAKWFAKAAGKGYTEGIYNLALLTAEGKGVKRNIDESFRLLKLAASHDILLDQNGLKIINFAVYQAEHVIGTRYHIGVGVPKDFQKALEWYIRAIKHGGGMAANNIGSMYSKGEGVQRNINMALNYYKLGASREAVRAMDNAALTYLGLADKENARKWFQFAIKRGSVYLQTKKQEFLILFGNDKEFEKSFQDDLFELQLNEEVKSGPLKHLIIDYKESTYDDLIKKSFLKDLKISEKLTGEATSRNLHGLSDPYRVAIILKHRDEFKLLRLQHAHHILIRGEGNLSQKGMKDVFNLKPICLRDMNPKTDHIYGGFAIKLTLIEDAVLGTPSVGQIVEDENGDAQRLYVYNVPQNKETHSTLGFGCRITVVNPYHRLAKDGRPAIRVDDPSSIFYHSALTNKKRCRYCGNESGQTVACRICKRAFYCSKMCLKKDAEKLNHQNTCIKNL